MPKPKFGILLVWIE